MTIYLFGLITLAIGVAAFAAIQTRRQNAMKLLPLKHRESTRRQRR